MKDSFTPIVLCLSGHDPVGGAGIQADIEAIHAQAVHACTAITALTVQNSQRVEDFEPVSPRLLRAQLQCLLADIRPDAVKIGMVGSVEIATVIGECLQSLGDVPVVLDPVLGGNLGGSLARKGLISALRQLLAHTTVLTPNSLELHQLAQSETPETELLALGSRALLVTGGHIKGDHICNTLWQIGKDPIPYQWERQAGEFHGSGCTLAACCAARLARGETIEEAVANAQHYTDQCIRRAVQIGQGQATPWR